jgi:hypothetical protein
LLVVVHAAGWLTLRTIWDAAFARVAPLDGPELPLTCITLITMAIMGLFAATAAAYAAVRHARPVIAVLVVLLCFASAFMSVLYLQTALIFTRSI